MAELQALKILLLNLLNLYQLILIIRILLSWFPAVDFYQQPFKLLHDLTEPALKLFRGLIPPIGMLDLSPIVLFLALNMLEIVINVGFNMVMGVG